MSSAKVPSSGPPSVVRSRSRSGSPPSQRGAKIGQTIDEADRACMGHSLELAARKDTVIWTNSATGVTYRVMPTRNLQEGKQHCREFTTELLSSKGRSHETITGVACRKPGGAWEFRA